MLSCGLKSECSLFDLRNFEVVVVALQSKRLEVFYRNFFVREDEEVVTFCHE